MIIRSPLNEDEYIAYYLLRWRVLRAPWGQERGSEKDELENESVHRIAILDNKIIGVGRLHRVDPTTVQIRYMAVAENAKNKGVGKAILLSLEKEAIESKADNIILNARESVVSFYQKQGYEIIIKSHLLFNEIQHFKMKKVI